MKHSIRWITLALAASCGSDTGRSRVDFEVQISGLNHRGPLANEHGWQIELSEAQLHVGPLYFFEGEPLFARVVRELFTIPSAHAHPGHYVEGEALADLLTGRTVDLLGEPVLLGRADGVTGEYNSVRVGLARADDLENHTAELAGTATKDGVTIPWRGTVDLEETVEGVAFGAEVAASNGYVHLDIDLLEWVRRIDFALVTGGAIEPGTQPHNALLRGVNNTSAFRFNWVTQ
jgi:hypothetical protein